ncbi:MAG: GNAT family N-acetyltransferase [Actinobacteria bacterium]|nr:GNAT family N-acetyltransferase [Actinomycetota bacterium]
MFTPIRTRRLTIRGFSADDVEDIVARRNDHRVAEYQNWPLPYTRAQADDLVSELVALGGPQDDAWWMAAVCDGATGDTLGDLAVHLSAGGRSAEVGYTFASNQWGNGYAVEALESLIAYLFEDLGVTRVFGMLHPDNVASAMVLERCGLLFEGHTRSSFWLEGEVSDDWIYGMVRADWERWRDRPRTRPSRVTLVEIDDYNAWEAFGLRTHKTQERFVAPMADSYADALFPEVVDGAAVVPWMRAVEADGDVVGFVIMALAMLCRLHEPSRHEMCEPHARTRSLSPPQICLGRHCPIAEGGDGWLGRLWRGN